MLRRALGISVLAGAAVVAVACGGGGGGTAPALGAASAGEIPASAALVVSIDTSFDSPATNRLLDLLDRFPAKDKLYARLRDDLGQRQLDFEADVKPALGPELAVVLLSFGESLSSNPPQVVLTKPDDPAKLHALLGKLHRPIARERVNGWTVMSISKDAIDRFKAARAAGPSLAASDAYADAMASLPSEPLATVYVNGAPVMTELGRQALSTIPTIGHLRWIAGALEAQGEGVSLDVHAEGDAVDVKRYASKLVDTAPEDALAFLSFANLGSALEKLGAQPQFRERAAEVADVARLLRGEGAVYVRAGAPIPEVTALLEQSDPATAVKTLDSVVSRFGGSATRTSVGGVQAKRIAAGPVGLYYAAVDGNLVVTDAAAGLRSVGTFTSRLSSEPGFQSATEAAGMPNETTGFLFVNLQDALPLLTGGAGESIPPDVTDNLKPLQALLAYTTVDGDVLSARVFLQVS